MIEKIKSFLPVIFSWVNSEAAFVVTMAVMMWAYQFKAHHDTAPFEMFGTIVLALCGGFFWNRRTKQKYNIKEAQVELECAEGENVAK